jgi:hypothetical protein
MYDMHAVMYDMYAVMYDMYAVMYDMHAVMYLAVLSHFLTKRHSLRQEL